ncbi:MAG TPA: metallophosphoesterase [[Clostridium] spiroforme]|uniref:Metallophosphoesterase n=1 Tax=Thomasclavelia spiroformis TaxID=29348 RepID=A0A921G9X9_9FIRM|nr:metallophosphoesterase [Thomasclavelia spiroformis]
MNDFTILHLSDLHIDREGKKLSILNENLLQDIQREMAVSENIIVVVTGDILNKAEYKYTDNVIAFFEKLYGTLGDKIKGLYIVPGNHDKIRNIMDESMVAKYDMLKRENKKQEFYQQYWKHLKMAFYEHIELLKDIYNIFPDNITFPKNIEKETYGVETIQIGSKNLCFLLFNTAWSCLGENDERHLLLGDFQMEEIKRQFIQKSNELDGAFDLTIAVAHHPIDWLDGREENMMKADILCNNSLNANIYICGHTHNRDVINWQNNRHSMTTLVSGLGWPDGNTNHPYAHTYSSYVFNLDVNSIDVYVRSSDDNYIFEPDFRIYTEKRNKEYNKIVMPINSCKTQAYFNLGTVKERSPKACYITDDIVHDLRRYAVLLGEIRSSIAHHLEKIKMDIYDNVTIDLISKKRIRTEDYGRICLQWEDFLFRGAKANRQFKYLLEGKDPLMYMQFTTYLQQICRTVHDVFYKKWPELRLRVHFRYRKREAPNRYAQLCLYGKDFDNYMMGDLEWGELLEKAYEAQQPLIASVNERYCGKSFEKNKTKTNAQWTDFITAIPKFRKNHFIKRDTLTEEISISRPLLTFGVTIYREEDRRILYLLDYLRIDEIIGDAIKDFLYYFPINIVRYIKSLNKS